MALKTGWVGTSFPGIGSGKSTYELFPLASLPPLEGPGSDANPLGWLIPIEPELADAVMDDDRSRVDDPLSAIEEQARELGLRLPPAFLTLMRSDDLRRRIPSVTACYFDLPAEIVPAPFAKGAWVLRFLNDQQGCAFWSLLLHRNREPEVITSAVAYDEPDTFEGATAEDLEPLKCADAFEAFLHRYWFEQRLWFALVRKHRPLTQQEQRYLSSYTQNR